MAERKYYWLKLKRDFFKRHDIRIIEAMPNGKDYILFYLKLLLESIDHEGHLRFSDTIPYNEQMLSVITDTNIDVVRAAMEVFERLKMIDILNDQTIYMAEVKKLIGSETKGAERVRKHRENQKLLHCNADVTLIGESVTQSKSIEQEVDLEEEPEKEPEPQKLNSIMDDFESLWELYPRKLGKKKAIAAYEKAIKKGVSFETIKRGIENYNKQIKANKTDTAYIKHGSTWFNGECWNDEYVTNTPAPTQEAPQANEGFDEWMNNFMKEGK